MYLLLENVPKLQCSINPINKKLFTPSKSPVGNVVLQWKDASQKKYNFSIMDEDYEEGEVVVTNVFGDVCIRKARRKRQKALVKEMLHDYANNTTLHGLGYTTKRGLTVLEKVFWLITFVASVCMCAYLIHNVYIKWKTSPVIVTVSEKLVPVRTVPFPSVLICPQSKVDAVKYNYTAESIRLGSIFKNNKSQIQSHRNDFEKFEDVTNVCGKSYSSCLRALKRNTSNAVVVKNINDVAPKRSQIFRSCKIGGSSDYNCERTITEVLTSEGLCYSINSLAADEILRSESIHNDFPYLTTNRSSSNWTMADGYTDYGPTAYPVPGKENGASPDLEIIMQHVVLNRDPTCNIVNTGYKVYIQHPTDLPQASLYYFAILNEQVSSMALSFSILDTSIKLKEYDPETRQCYFPNERYLKYFKIYTANNCKMECLTNITYERCNCVGFYMPYETSEQICSFRRSTCMNEARDELVTREANKLLRRCRCLPTCNAVDYEAEILKTDYNLKGVIKAISEQYNIPLQLNGTQFSKLEMYFKRSRFVSMHRSELFGPTDFLANIGGLLGLFLGFSFLSLVELFYFLTLRLWFALKKDLKEEKLQRQNTITKKY